MSNPKTAEDMDYRNSEFQRLMHCVIVVDNDYNIADLAAFLGKKLDTIYAYCEGEVRLHLDIACRILRYVAITNPDDTRFLDVFLRPAGRISVPDTKAKVCAEDRKLDQIHLSILNGEALKEIEDAFGDGKLDKNEMKRIDKRLGKLQEKAAELKEKLRGEVR